MAKRIYIETTIPSFYHTLRSDDESRVRMSWTRRWWDEYAGLYELTTSAAVLDELSRSTSDNRQDRLDLLRGVELLPITPEVEGIAAVYIERLVMPDDPTGDALHLALASFYGMDILLTWNCKHIANPNKTGHIRKVNVELGLATPQLLTPLNFLGGDD